MLKTKEEWRNLALGLAAIYIGFVIFLAQTDMIIGRAECDAIIAAHPWGTTLFKVPAEELK